MNATVQNSATGRLNSRCGRKGEEIHKLPPGKSTYLTIATNTSATDRSIDISTESGFLYSFIIVTFK